MNGWMLGPLGRPRVAAELWVPCTGSSLRSWRWWAVGCCASVRPADRAGRAPPAMACRSVAPPGPCAPSRPVPFGSRPGARAPRAQAAAPSLAPPRVLLLRAPPGVRSLRQLTGRRALPRAAAWEIELRLTQLVPHAFASDWRLGTRRAEKQQRNEHAKPPKLRIQITYSNHNE